MAPDGVRSADVRALLDHLSTQLPTDVAWRTALGGVREGEVALHLAILREPFLGELLAGRKTIESRFSRVRCAPWGAIAKDDLVVLKAVGGPVVGTFVAGDVECVELNQPAMVHALRLRHAEALGATDDDFWERRAAARYATLVRVAGARAIAPALFPKRDRRGWVVLARRRSSVEVR
jgi:hypothetical protein